MGYAELSKSSESSGLPEPSCNPSLREFARRYVLGLQEDLFLAFGGAPVEADIYVRADRSNGTALPEVVFRRKTTARRREVKVTPSFPIACEDPEALAQCVLEELQSDGIDGPEINAQIRSCQEASIGAMPGKYPVDDR
jgi:hypothetical protein